MPNISDSERGLAVQGSQTNGNGGDFLGTESKNGVNYARFRAKRGTWVSASMAELGYDKLYGRDTAYGARTGIVLGANGKPLPTPDKIQPGQEYLIPIGTKAATTAKPAVQSSARNSPATNNRPATAVPPRRSRELASTPANTDLLQRPQMQRNASPANRALDNRGIENRITTDAADGGGDHYIPEPDGNEKCYSPFPITGEEYASILGLVAHAFIEQDFVESKQLRRDRNVHIDDSFHYKRYNNFLINKNLRTLTPAQKATIKAYRGPRPDIVLDTPAEKGFEEIKPDSAAAIERGVKQVQDIADFMDALKLPYSFGTSYVPKPEILIAMFFVLGEPVDVYLDCRRERGLILYRYCFRADWKRLKGKLALVFELLIKFIWIVLTWMANEKSPVPGPAPIPAPPLLPEPTPDLQPIITPPDTVPVSQRVSGYVPSTTLKVLKAIPKADIARLANQGVEIEFEPYVPR